MHAEAFNPRDTSAQAQPAARAGTVETSAQALNAIGMDKRKTNADKVIDIVVACQRNGVRDMSRGEIRDQMELVHGRRFDSGWVSARVKELIDAKRLERVVIRRPCCSPSAGKSGDIEPVRVPMTQARLVA